MEMSEPAPQIHFIDQFGLFSAQSFADQPAVAEGILFSRFLPWPHWETSAFYRAFYNES
jgi:hypothetical protein